MPQALTLDDLMAMDADALAGVMERGHAIDRGALAESRYRGVDLSLPGFARKLLWHTFEKVFTRDGAAIRGWNVMLEQTGVYGERVPRRSGDEERTFGHYLFCDHIGDRTFPGAWDGPHFLDYGRAGNARLDPAALGMTPLVAVNEGSAELLLGWEVFCVAGVMLPMRLYWALERRGALPPEAIVSSPRARA